MALGYSLVVLPTGPDSGHDEVTLLAPNLITWRGTLNDVIEPSSLVSWKDAFGRFMWSDITSIRRFVMAWSNPFEPALSKRVMIAPLAMKLVTLVTPFHGTVHRLNGGALSVDPVRLEGISVHEPLPEIRRPLYASREVYHAAYRAPTGYEPDPPWFDDWQQWITCLETIREIDKPLILRNAIGSFERGLTNRDVDARIPELVRAAEAIIALPRISGGTQVFVRRAMRFVAHLTSNPYLCARGGPKLPQSHIAPGKQGQSFLDWYNASSTTDLERWLAVLVLSRRVSAQVAPAVHPMS
jgi:hypothetical protein